jgi:hypothetical protein
LCTRIFHTSFFSAAILRLRWCISMFVDALHKFLGVFSSCGFSQGGGWSHFTPFEWMRWYTKIYQLNSARKIWLSFLFLFLFSPFKIVFPHTSSGAIFLLW